MNITLEIWRQPAPGAEGRFETYEATDVTPDMTLVELLDRLNAALVESGEEPVAFESDCREGVCGSCGITVDGRPHGRVANTPTCMQHLRVYPDRARIRLEPFRSAAFPVLRDLVVDRSALDRVVQAGGYVSVDAGTAPDADSVLTSHDTAESALDFSACIGCGACVAACPNGSAALFVGAKLAHLALMPHGRQERSRRAPSMAGRAETEFGPCSLYGECARVCPAGIPLSAVAAVNRERLRAWWTGTTAR